MRMQTLRFPAKSSVNSEFEKDLSSNQSFEVDAHIVKILPLSLPC
jgi:hypothetical protein